ncbi:MFS transporter [Martelella sp. HB161492]|uniref:MFS transporter n=1 Tax=Martelella sp. HB161492 TaxID=2720726 RepID=UPI001591F0ED|nr:MFS transporter [Martelella sp. HB161492]
MPKTLSLVYSNPVLRLSAAGLFFFGFAGAATSPYLSIIGIQELGMTDRAYAMVILLGALVSVVASILIGSLADRIGSFRVSLMVTSLTGVIGFLWVYLLPSQSSFTIAKILFIPFFTALNPLIFANVRVQIVGRPYQEMVSVNSAVRAVLSLSWVLVPGVVGALLAGSSSMLPSFLFAGLASLVCVSLFSLSGHEPEAVVANRRSEPFLKAFAAFAGAGLWIRLLAISLITAMMHMCGTVLPLIITGQAGGTVSDVGLLVGIVAGLEIVFIIFWSYVERVLPHVVTLVIGAAVYVVYLYLLGHVSEPWQAYALTPVAGLGAAAIISVPITYLQNLIEDRPGVGSSLISVNMFASAGLGAGLFALGTRFTDYSGTAVLSAAAGLIGCILVLALDGPKRQR